MGDDPNVVTRGVRDRHLGLAHDGARRQCDLVFEARTEVAH